MFGRLTPVRHKTKKLDRERRQRFYAVICPNRAGSNALRGALEEHSDIKDLKDLFHPTQLETSLHFFHFLQNRWRRKIPNASWPSRKELFNAYFNHIHRQTKGQEEILFFKASYLNLHVLDTFWRGPQDPPFLLHLMKECDFGIIHLYRSNVLAAYISNLRAKAVGQWKIFEESQKPGPVPLSTETLIDELEKREREIQTVRQWIGDYPRSIELRYEDLFEDNVLRMPVKKKIADFLGIESDGWHPKTPIRPMGYPNLEDVITNPDDVRKVLTGTPFERMAEELYAA